MSISNGLNSLQRLYIGQNTDASNMHFGPILRMWRQIRSKVGIDFGSGETEK
jgi:hypothetical protein